MSPGGALFTPAAHAVVPAAVPAIAAPQKLLLLKENKDTGESNCASNSYAYTNSNFAGLAKAAGAAGVGS
jgi:hypothetical protein